MSDSPSRGCSVLSTHHRRSSLCFPLFCYTKAYRKSIRLLLLCMLPTFSLISLSAGTHTHTERYNLFSFLIHVLFPLSVDDVKTMVSEKKRGVKTGVRSFPSPTQVPAGLSLVFSVCLSVCIVFPLFRLSALLCFSCFYSE